MLTRAAAAAMLLLTAAASTGFAAGGPGAGSAGICDGAPLTVTVCAEQGGSPSAGGSPSDGAGSAGSSTHADASDAQQCTYTKLDPQPPADNVAWGTHQPGDGQGALYGVNCPDTGRVGVVWMANGNAPAAPRIDPAVLAQRAVDSMTLLGPDIASPRAAGRYTVGVPMWMWANQSATTYGPNSASASAGGVTVTATAKVSKIVWQMGDGATVTCTGPGTPYKGSVGMAESPTCGHVYSKSSARASGGKYRVTATSTWTVSWEGGGEAGQLSEVRQSNVQVAVGEVQVVG